MSEQMLSVDGISGLLRAVAGRMEGNVDGLNKELLLQSAEKLDKLETIADIAEMIIDRVPHAKSGRIRKAVLVECSTLFDLGQALEAAGKRIRKGNI